jgi:hypothetical protein
MVSRILTALIIVLGLSILSPAQQTACKTVEIPVGVMSMTGDGFRGLAAEDFIAHVQKKQVAVKSLTYDDGPRRVLIVLDANKKLSPDARKAEGEMVRTMIAAARPEDTFALIPAHGNGKQVKFTPDRSAITLELGWDGGGSDGKELGVLDAVMTGIEWFGAPQSGDAIVLIAADTEGNHKANAKLVAKALEEHHIRMFGLALGPVQTKSSVAGGTMTSTTSQGLAYTKPLVGDGVYSTGDEHFFPLTANSGGLVFAAINTDTRRSYSMNDARVLQEIRQKALAVSKMISAYYRMQIEPPPLTHPEAWSLEVNEEIRKHSQPMVVLYPVELGPC